MQPTPEKIQAEKKRLYEMSVFERENEDCALIAGVDEAGRGPLAGPVIAAAVILPKNCEILFLNDSKKLTEKKRDELYDIILDKCIAYGLGREDHDVIDDINILQATYKAMKKAVDGLSVKPELCLTDAVTIPDLDIKQIPIIKGDQKSISIAAASVIAKVTRDRIMKDMDKLYPEYGFAKHKGYGTKEHMESIIKYGPSPVHRKTFIKKLTEKSNEG